MKHPHCRKPKWHDNKLELKEELVQFLFSGDIIANPTCLSHGWKQGISFVEAESLVQSAAALEYVAGGRGHHEEAEDPLAQSSRSGPDTKSAVFIDNKGRGIFLGALGQERNGPCGILCAIHAWIIRLQLFSTYSGGVFHSSKHSRQKDFHPNGYDSSRFDADRILASALAHILVLCSRKGTDRQADVCVKTKSKKTKEEEEKETTKRDEKQLSESSHFSMVGPSCAQYVYWARPFRNEGQSTKETQEGEKSSAMFTRLISFLMKDGEATKHSEAVLRVRTVCVSEAIGNEEFPSEESSGKRNSIKNKEQSRTEQLLVSAVEKDLLRWRHIPKDEEKETKEENEETKGKRNTHKSHPQGISEAAKAEPSYWRPLDMFKGSCGLLLFVISMAMSQLTSHHRGGNSSATVTATGDKKYNLIASSWALCSQALVNFALFGVPTESIGTELVDRVVSLASLEKDTSAKKRRTGDCRHTTTVPFGLLSFTDAQSKVHSGVTDTVDPALKKPLYPIWIVLGEDHYTLLFEPIPHLSDIKKKEKGKVTENMSEHRWGLPPPPNGYLRYLLHYNGLPPSGPRFALLQLKCCTKREEEPSSSEDPPEAVDGSKDKMGMVKRMAPPVAMIVQRKERGKQLWEYEVAFSSLLEAEHTGGEEEARKPEAAEVGEQNQKESGAAKESLTLQETSDTHCPFGFQLRQSNRRSGSPWRCRHCVLNEGYFKVNDAGATHCSNCKAEKSSCGRTYWLREEELPPLALEEARMHYWPKIVSVIATAWPEAQVSFMGEKTPTI